MSDQRPVALITGGAKRVGRAIALELAAAGFDIAITTHESQVAGNELVRELSARFTGCQTLQIPKADLTQTHSAEYVADFFRALYRRLDVLINNASLYKPATLADTTPQLMRDLMAIHFETPLLLAQQLAPMLRANRGHIINLADLLAEKPWPQYLAYCASKAALLNLTLGLAKELAPEVTVNAIAPGVVEWPEDYPPEQREKYLKRVPLGRAGTPDDVAKLVRFLVTEGKYLTGQVLRLDGGRSIT